ncbi:MAG: hypothetical protein II702_10685 [Clostridia bacterium]|jgi:hypothetical protein|nr:hypothetical protein [Clostridia bacterium]MBQ4245365.1 hypothetical protein [Clostridia bacterium]
MDYTALLQSLVNLVAQAFTLLSKFDITKIDTNSIAGLATYISPLVQVLTKLLANFVSG